MAHDYYISIPAVLKESQSIQCIQHSYPFHIIENKNTFRFVSQEEMIEELNSVEIADDPDHLHFNIYTIDGDFYSERPGADSMGGLKHDHIDNDFIEWYRKEGEEFLKRRRILLGYGELYDE